MNVCGFAEKNKRADVFDWLKQNQNAQFSVYKMYIIINEKNKNSFRNDWGLNIIYCGYSCESRGLMVGFDDKIDYCRTKFHKDNQGNQGNLLIIK